MTTEPGIDLLYLRKSRDKAELADPDLLHKHRREMLRLIETRGHQVAPELIFEEQGSGDTLRARPACRRVLEIVDRLPRAHGGRLWTTEVSRLTRGSLSDRARVHSTLSRAHILHCTRGSDYDLNRTSDLMRWEIETTVAHHELGVYRERVEAARIELALEGRSQSGKVPFGWWWDRNQKNPDGSRGRPEIDPVKFPVVQALCREAPHHSLATLAERYGLEVWQVWDVLRNPFICGYPVKRFFPHKGERTRKDTGEEWLNPSARASRDRWIWPQQVAGYQAACTREEWEAIQEALDRRRRSGAKTQTANSWCAPVVQFVDYPGRARAGAQWGAGGRVMTYDLAQPREKRYGLCHVYILREPVHARVVAAIAGLIDNAAWREYGVRAYVANRQPEAPTDAAHMEAEARRIERLLDLLLDRELRAADDGDTREVASIMRQRDQYKRELATVEKSLHSMSLKTNRDGAVEELLPILESLGADGIRAVLDGAELEDSLKQRVVAGFVEGVRVRVTRPPGQHKWAREIEEVTFRPAWRPFM